MSRLVNVNIHCVLLSIINTKRNQLRVPPHAIPPRRCDTTLSLLWKTACPAIAALNFSGQHQEVKEGRLVLVVL